MAEKRKIKAKWIVVAVALLLVGVVLTIVFVNLFTKKDTREVSGALHASVQSGFLCMDNFSEQNPAVFVDYLLKMQNNPLLGENAQDTALQKEKMISTKQTLESFAVVANFVDRQFVYSAYTNFYKQNRKAAVGALSAAAADVQSIESYIAKLPPVEQSDFWQAQTWIDLCPTYESLLCNTARAVVLLGQLYGSCVSSPIWNNNFSKIVFAEIEQFSQPLFNKEQTPMDSQGFAGFVNAYVSNETYTKIARYAFDTALQVQVDNIFENGRSGADYQTFVAGKLA